MNAYLAGMRAIEVSSRRYRSERANHMSRQEPLCDKITLYVPKCRNKQHFGLFVALQPVAHQFVECLQVMSCGVTGEGWPSVSSAYLPTSATVRSSARRRSPARDPKVSQTSPPARRGWQLPCTTTLSVVGHQSDGVGLSSALRNRAMASAASRMSSRYSASVRIDNLRAGKDRISDTALETVLQHEVYRAGKQVR